MKSGFESISDMSLANVTGGTTPATGTSSTSSNDQLMTAVQGIQSSLKDIGSSKNQGLFGGNGNGLMFMTMALAMQRRQQSNVVVVNGGRGGYGYWHGGW